VSAVEGAVSAMAVAAVQTALGEGEARMDQYWTRDPVETARGGTHSTAIGVRGPGAISYLKLRGCSTSARCDVNRFFARRPAGKMGRGASSIP